MTSETHITTVTKNNNTGKEARYEAAIGQIGGVISGEKNLIANLANIAAILHNAFNFWWTGFYLVEGNELVLGPFQGPVACTRIGFGKGVCGTSWQKKESIVVEDVHAFPGHIACSAASNSEIVVPVMHEGNVVMVLDIDSESFAAFDAADRKFLERIAVMISNKYPGN